MNGGTASASFGNVETVTGMAYGVSQPTQYGDPTALLTGSWGPDQTVTATVKITGSSSGCCEEVELRLRGTISVNSITNYEITCSVVSSPAYLQIVRWNGPVGDYTYIDNSDNIDYCSNGDILKASITGSTIKVYLNGGLKITATDTVLKSGAPGMGFFTTGEALSNYGFSSYTATDGLVSMPLLR